MVMKHNIIKTRIFHRDESIDVHSQSGGVEDWKWAFPVMFILIVYYFRLAKNNIETMAGHSVEKYPASTMQVGE